ncbi:hypothetical protein [Rubellicoccus peritrichatus]|uniref:Uncharacterized protein n=1 Tax=Rubellicoccus peritrichatus TaxID=3080537 RepID=A0AAQ3LFW5_9BACT|nr:hypothetical protein [Puniceicoccus sp. CR14]WOO43063.1 hypothetical protein RZN69_08150 [Puniceicoccus sp. CR14]
MAEESATNGEVNRLIESYAKAQKDRRTARYLMTALIAIIVLVFIFLGVATVKSFHEEQVDEFAEALAEEAADISPMVWEHLNDATNRALPKIEDAFVSTFVNNSETYVEVLSDNYLDLQSYAQLQWPQIEEALAGMVMAQEDTAKASLAKYVPEDKLVNLSESYRAAMENYLERFFEDNFAGDMATAQDVVDKLHQIAETESDMPPADSQYIIGMFLELLGMEMQLDAQE